MKHLLLTTFCTITVIGNCVHAFNMLFYGLEGTTDSGNVTDTITNYPVLNLTEFDVIRVVVN